MVLLLLAAQLSGYITGVAAIVCHNDKINKKTKSYNETEKEKKLVNKKLNAVSSIFKLCVDCPFLQKQRRGIKLFLPNRNSFRHLTHTHITNEFDRARSLHFSIFIMKFLC